MTIYKQLTFSAVLLCQALLSGCSQRTEYSANLPKEVNETSGLVCRNNAHFLTINDSGNGAIVWELNNQGQLARQLATSQPNLDWEAITSSQTSLFIADTGNNSGRRHGGQIYQYSLTDLPKVTFQRTIEYQFANYPEKPLIPYRHDFDIEAVTVNQSQLIMFSKSWSGGPTQVYRLMTTADEVQIIKPIAELPALPGVVTDATWSESQHVYLLTGYANFQQSLISVLLSGHWSPFIAVISDDFQLLAMQSISDAGQLEAICLDEDNYIWLSQEQYKNSAARLWRFGSVDSLLKSKENR